MLLIIKPEIIDDNTILLGEKLKNNISGYSNYYPIFLILKQFTLQNLAFQFDIYHYTIDMYFNKYKISFDKDKNTDFTAHVAHIEESILNNICVDSKMPCYKLKDQIEKQSFKFNEYYQENTCIPYKESDRDIVKGRNDETITNNHTNDIKHFTMENSDYIRDTSLTNIIQHGKILLRISGIWENSTHYGIIYKFVYICK